MDHFILINKYFHLMTRTGAILIALWIINKGYQYNDLSLKLLGLVLLIFDTDTHKCYILLITEYNTYCIVVKKGFKNLSQTILLFKMILKYHFTNKSLN